MPLSPRGTRAALAGVALVALGACQADRSTGVDPALAKGSSTTSGPSSGGSTDTTRTNIRLFVTAGSSTFVIGAHMLVFGNNLSSICDPATSTYGAAEWDKPCAPATSAVTIQVKSWYDANGHPQIDFSPALRFVPTADPSKQVRLYLKDRAEAARLVGARILYCAKFTGTKPQCADESLTDPTVATTLETSGFLVRQIKHFSGYNVAAREDLSF